MPTNRNRLLALALAAFSATAFAQNTTTTPDSTIGVTPSEAREAMKEAVPRSDTATVTRTDESAADKARRAGDATADALTPGRDRDTSSATGSTSSTMGAGTGSGSAATTGSGSADAQATRPARADRH
ncbi:hypothetical protein [uncultured Azohydromonas sp.]|jgi:hypothetical protein|uniref:hypothetical protein n=1 Tax=uncultured Azohydromonas sp. TaxID=487342 RepID=UPI00263530ED|nr:hypothetical protein [uncultured Azohydromonas sp.]